MDSRFYDIDSRDSGQYHHVDVIGPEEIDTFDGSECSQAVLVVVRAITPGSSINNVVLGRWPTNVELHFLNATHKATVFEARAIGGTPEWRAWAIAEMAERLATLANQPSRTLELLQQEPFSGDAQPPL